MRVNIKYVICFILIILISSNNGLASNTNLKLEKAIEKCSKKHIKKALEGGAKPFDHYNNNPSSRTYFDMVDAYCSNLRVGGHFASEEETVEIYKLMIKHSENFKFANNPLPYTAITESWEKVLIYFLENGTDPDMKIEGDYPTEIAFSNEQLDAYDLLIKYGATALSKQEKDALNLIRNVGDNNINKVKKMLSDGVNINFRPKNGDTVLNSAIKALVGMEEKYLLISLLLDRGADVNAKIYSNKSHYQILHVASILCNPKKKVKTERDYALRLFNLLIDKGADISGVDSRLKTPLHWAVSADNIEGAKILIDNGAGVNVEDSYGNPPITEAESEKMRSILIANGAKDVPKKESTIKFLRFPLYYSMVENTLKHGKGCSTELLERKDLWGFWWKRGLNNLEKEIVSYNSDLTTNINNGSMNKNQAEELMYENLEQLFKQFIYDNWDEINLSIVEKPSEQCETFINKN